jgi:FKBP12-rapamycin complex-associated protein
MGLLRDNRDSVMAMLEAFVYDPLISWRLLGDESKEIPAQAQQSDVGLQPIASEELLGEDCSRAR